MLQHKKIIKFILETQCCNYQIWLITSIVLPISVHLCGWSLVSPCTCLLNQADSIELSHYFSHYSFYGCGNNDIMPVVLVSFIYWNLIITANNINVHASITTILFLS